MRQFLLLGAAVAGLAVTGFAYAQAVGHPPSAAGIAIAVPKTVYDLVVTEQTAKLTVTSTSIVEGQLIADAHAQNGANKSPQLAWTPGPARTRSYIVVLEAPIAGQLTSTQHWIIYDILPTVTSLPEGVPEGVFPAAPKDAIQAIAENIAGYRGPRPTAGETHSYVFQVFAIDSDFLPGGGGGPEIHDHAHVNVDAAALGNSIRGHVLAAGTLTARYTGR
jgi:Raf kinase inhibitor-like YbhB/YbcL family protein